MWKEVSEFVDKLASPENKDELMTIYLTYIIHPFKFLNQSEQYKIAIDIIELKKIISQSNGKSYINAINKKKFKSRYIKKQLKILKDDNVNKNGYNQLIKNCRKYVEMAFILKNIEKYHRLETMKYIVSTLLAILSIIATIKITIIKI